MEENIKRLIKLNIELEGALRVLSDRRTDEALETVRSKYSELIAEYAKFDSEISTNHAEENLTEIKEEEAVGAENEPLPEPNLPTDDEAMELIRRTESETDCHKDGLEEIKEAEPEPAKPAEPEKQVQRDAKDFNKLLTLNDKFLFKRELFNNSESELTDTISLISSMDTFDECREYLYEDLRWDSANEVVKNFMGLVAKFFEEK